MYRDSDRQKLFSRRAAILAGGKVVLLSTLVGRMYYLQIVEAERYRTLSDENRINIRLLSPPRGRILDRFGVPLADNEQDYRAILISENTPNLNYTLDMLNQIIPIGSAERRRIGRDIKRHKNFVPVSVKRNLTWQDVSKIEVNAPDLPGILIDSERSRKYSYGEDLAHVLGYVAAVSTNEATGDPLLELPGARIGKAGVEKYHDLVLRGSGGNSQLEVNAFGRVIRELSRQEGQPGAEITLTIDIGLQRMITRRLTGQSAAAVVIDVHNGDILAMASTPSFDPNTFSRGLKPSIWKELKSNPMAPLTNKAIAGVYSPGSTFKMAVLLAALDKGVISPSTKFFCKGYIELGNAKFHCWKKYGHGNIAARMAIAQSCDVYFYEIAKRTGIDRIAEMANRLGLGVELGIDLPGEHTGLIPTKRWKRGALDTPWYQGETLIAGIGQGYVQVTPLQLAVMTARLTNGGVAVVPRLTKAVNGENVPINREPDRTTENLKLPKSHLDLVVGAMTDVVNSPYGTAFKSRIEESDFVMGGKTGTVQVRRITKAERKSGVVKNRDLPWEDRDHALFVGFAPVGKPRYAVAVVVEHGGGGSSVAAPIARDILLEAQRRESAGAYEIPEPRLRKS